MCNVPLGYLLRGLRDFFLSVLLLPAITFAVIAFAYTAPQISWAPEWLHSAQRFLPAQPMGLSDWAAATGLVFAVPTLLFAWRGLRQGRRLVRLSTRAQVVQACTQRYHEIEGEYAEARSENRAPSRLYYRRYWALQSDQLDFYLAGWVDVDTLRSWLFNLCDRIFGSFDRDMPEGMRASWEEQYEKYSHSNPMFAAMAQEVFSFRDSETYATEKHSPTLVAIAFTDVLLDALERRSEPDRKMLQRRYGVLEHRRRIDETRDQRWFDWQRDRALYSKRLKIQSKGLGGRRPA